YDYWTASADRKADPNEEEQAQYDYRDWIESTYNCKITQIAKGDWGSNATELVNFYSAPDGTLCLYILPPDFVGGPMANNAFAAWNETDLVDMTSDHWNAADVEFMTKAGKVYGVATGNSEPRQCLYFNKRVLEEAGIDWNTIYDMQADGTWTWEAFENLCAQLTKDNDADGVYDVYGLTGNVNDLMMAAVFGNGGSFFDFDENGKLKVTADSDNTIEALNWSTTLWNNYARKAADGEQWNYFIEVFKSGNCGFLVHQTYGGYNEQESTDLHNMQDDWGCVAVPKGPKGDTYKYIISDNIVVVPDIYDAETTKKIQFIYGLYNSTAPGVDADTAWIGKKYEICSDERAVDETYAMLREGVHAKADRSLYLGDNNTILGSSTYGNYLWGMIWSTPTALTEAIKPAWDGLCAVFNGDMTEEDFQKMLEEKAAAEAAAAEEAPAEEAPAE
ncbi:MAG: hypothetical protein K5922_04825, partial [Clostridiales bacterium]|nr:hypothetical protein [Clostridiales bacterium]